jgi:hypothetical protein
MCLFSPKSTVASVNKILNRASSTGQKTKPCLRCDLLLEERLINSRNAVEHPGGRSGTLMIENFKITPVGLTPPTWTRVGNEPRPSTFVFHDLDVFQHNMLTFAEDILLCGIENHPIAPRLSVVFLAGKPSPDGSAATKPSTTPATCSRVL